MTTDPEPAPIQFGLADSGIVMDAVVVAGAVAPIATAAAGVIREKIRADVRREEIRAGMATPGDTPQPESH